MIFSIFKIVFFISIVLTFVPLLIWLERKGSAYIQDRRGPNRASIAGIKLGGFIHNFADVLKLFFKEDVMCEKAHPFLFTLAPILALTVAISLVAPLPFAAPVQVGSGVYNFQIADMNIGLLYILAIGAMGVFSTLIAGAAGGGTYSLFGGLRAAAQNISYEVAMGAALLSVIMSAGSVRLDEIVALQGNNLVGWNIFIQPLAAMIFLVALFAETNRNPFDLPEGESELVGGYHTEYSSMRFALFFMAEYAHIAVASMIFVTLFLGGWQIPFVPSHLDGLPGFLVPLQIAAFLLKTFAVCWLFIWVRWTLPRFRYDQLMKLGWTALLPLALINLIVTGVVLAY